MRTFIKYNSQAVGYYFVPLGLKTSKKENDCDNQEEETSDQVKGQQEQGFNETQGKFFP